MKKIPLKRYTFFQKVTTFLFLPAKWFVYHFKVKSKYKIAKGESVFVLANHQTDLDPILINYSFNKLVTPVATDTLFSNKFAYKFLPYAYGVIPKKKGVTDNQATIKMLKLLRGGGSILLFPEGNRTVAEFQFFITPKLAAFVKKTGSTLVLYKIQGGTGVSPRFGSKHRKGPFSGEITKVLKPEEYNQLSDEELNQIIKDGIKAFDSYSGCAYKSKTKAEYLERILFVCPKCLEANTLHSHKDTIKCERCGLEAKYTEHLTFESSDKDFRFTYLNDWYQFQKRWIKEHEFVEDVIFNDDNIELYVSNPYEKRKVIAKGTMTLTKTKLICGEVPFDLENIISASVIGGRKYSFTTNDNSYLVVGKGPFNPFKYVLLFNKLETKMKDNTSQYFTLEEDL